MDASSTGPAVRRRRPKDRRNQIVATAALQFRELGYRQVSMADLAEGVQIGASALYRHFRGKSDLLVAVLDEALGQLEAAAAGRHGRDELLTALVEVTLGQREYAALWDREFAELPADAVAGLRARRQVILGRIADSARADSADGSAGLRARAALAVLESPSRHHVEIERETGVRLLRDAAAACLSTALPAPVEATPVDGTGEAIGLLPCARSEALLAVAGQLFAREGYHAVSLAQVGAAAGIAGPSIYKHFPSKLDLLTAILNRGNEALWFALHQVLTEAATAQDALDRLLDSYLAVVSSRPGAVSVLLTQVANLPDEQRATFRATQQRYVAEWVALVGAWRTGLSDAQARMLVHAALAVANALTQRHPTGAHGTGPAAPNQVGALSRAVLGLPCRAGR